VRTVRFLIRSQDGPDCCVAVDPEAVPRDPETGQRVLILSGLAAGPATLTISGFPTDFAPNAGVANRCNTDPAAAGRSCDAGRNQSPSFESAPQNVTIVAGAQSDAGDILIPALPFVVPGSLDPAANASAPNPLSVGFTVADAVTGIEESSVALEIRQNGAAVGGPDLGLEACDDAGANPCSGGGGLAVSGFRAVRPAQTLGSGAASLRITARNLAAQPRELDFTYGITVLAPPPDTATPTPQPSATATPVPTATRTPVTPAPTSTATSTATRTNTRRPPTATDTRPSTATRTPTPTATPASPTQTPTPIRRFAFIGAQALPVSGEPRFLTAADLDGDGFDDLLAVSPQSAALSVLRGSADSPTRFIAGTVQNFGRGLGRAVVGDLNGDSILDVAVPDDRDGGVWTLIGEGDGRLGTATFVDLDTPINSVAIADFDGASNADLAATDPEGNAVLIRLNEGQTQPRFRTGPRLIVGRSPQAVFAVDLNDDGAPDLAALTGRGTESKMIAVLLFERVTAGLPLFSDPVPFEVAQNPEETTLADMDGDGNLDFVMLSQSEGFNETDIDVILSNGDGTLGARRSFLVPCPFFTGGIACRGYSLAAADFDRNGDVDVAVSLDDPRQASTTNDAVEVFTGRPDGGVVAESSFTTAKRPLAITAGDFNGDGLDDIAVSSIRDLTIQAFINVSPAAP
jgi:hypothetical protein